MTKKELLSPVGMLFILMAVSYAVLLLIQLWSEAFDGELFWKISITYGVVAGVTLAIYLIRREFVDNKQLKDDKYID